MDGTANLSIAEYVTFLYLHQLPVGREDSDGAVVHSSLGGAAGQDYHQKIQECTHPLQRRRRIHYNFCCFRLEQAVARFPYFSAAF